MYPTNCNVGGATFNPYYPASPMMQQQSPSYTRPMIIGKVVNKIEEVTPNDIPMDGSFGIFPLQDKSQIFLKKWNSDGTITTRTFVEKEIDIPTEPEKDPIDEKLTTIQFNIDQLREAFDKIEKSLKPKTTSNKKEVAVNE